MRSGGAVRSGSGTRTSVTVGRIRKLSPVSATQTTPDPSVLAAVATSSQSRARPPTITSVTTLPSAVRANSRAVSPESLWAHSTSGRLTLVANPDSSGTAAGTSPVTVSSHSGHGRSTRTGGAAAVAGAVVATAVAATGVAATAVVPSPDWSRSLFAAHAVVSRASVTTATAVPAVAISSTSRAASGRPV